MATIGVAEWDSELVADEFAAAAYEIRHAGYYWLLRAESHLTRRLFAALVRRTDAVAVPAG